MPVPGQKECMMEEDIYSCDEEEGQESSAPWQNELGKNPC